MCFSVWGFGLEKLKIDLKKIKESLEQALGNELFLNRIIGKAIDLIIAIAFASILYPAGPLAAFLYILICDGLRNGQSLGKIVVGLYVVNTRMNQRANFKDSIIRNSPIALIVLFLLIPLWGWILWFIIGLPVLAMEVYLMKSVENQLRLGDTMADTRVLALEN